MYIHTVVFYDYDATDNEVFLNVLGVFTDGDDAKKFFNVACAAECREQKDTHVLPKRRPSGFNSPARFSKRGSKSHCAIEIKTTRTGVELKTANPYAESIKPLTKGK